MWHTLGVSYLRLSGLPRENTNHPTTSNEALEIGRKLPTAFYSILRVESLFV
jgi:hypothetical protein